jgi:Sulfotransferase family
MRRTFVVGCPRSGTTVVQALLARHPEVFTLPETAFFERLLRDLEWRWGDNDSKPFRRRWRHKLGFARKEGRDALNALQHSLLQEEGHAPRIPLRAGSCIQAFARLLDGIASKAGRSVWIEKTPNHLLYIPEIEACFPEARFIHVIRPGDEVLASVADANLRFENIAFKGDTVLWARRWNHAALIHRAHRGRPNHHFIFLEDLIRQPDEEWARLCEFLEIQADAKLEKTDGKRIADLKSEPWKSSAVDGRLRNAERKVERIYGPDMRQWIDEQLTPYRDLYTQLHNGSPSAEPADQLQGMGKLALVRRSGPGA